MYHKALYDKEHNEFSESKEVSTGTSSKKWTPLPPHTLSFSDMELNHHQNVLPQADAALLGYGTFFCIFFATFGSKRFKDLIPY